jgi:hypothetical protein
MDGFCWAVGLLPQGLSVAGVNEELVSEGGSVVWYLT